MQITLHFSYDELTTTSTGLENKPTDEQLQRIKDLCIFILEPIRVKFGAVIINSCFRSPEVNKAIGGAKTSQHMANNGAAADIGKVGEVKLSEVFEYIINVLNYDQAIWEGGNENEPAWIHVSYNGGKNRKQALRMIKVDGKNYYTPYKQ